MIQPPTVPRGRRRILTGVKPTGSLHLGNYFGAIFPCIQMSHDPNNEVILLCADWHGLTNRDTIKEAGALTNQIIASYLALGFHLPGNSILVQSQFHEILENNWYLSCVTPVGLLERAHAFKDAVGQGLAPNTGLFTYPILMAADILTFDTQAVPVGKDQAQHLEYTSDMSKSFNAAVSETVFYAPQPIFQNVPLLVGIDGQNKMSKSRDNYIPLFGTPKDIEKRIKGIKTDSKSLDDKKDPEVCTIFKILQSFGSSEAIAYRKERLEKGTGYGYGHAKSDLWQEHKRVFGSKQNVYEHYLNSPEEVKLLLSPGFERAKHYADSVRMRAKHALGSFC